MSGSASADHKDSQPCSSSAPDKSLLSFAVTGRVDNTVLRCMCLLQFQKDFHLNIGVFDSPRRPQCARQFVVRSFIIWAFAGCFLIVGECLSLLSFQTEEIA